jgi:hypothetical protein
MAENKIIKRWEDYGKKHLLNKTIKMVRYMSDEEQEAMGWYHKPLVIQLDDGTLLIPSADDEGNEAGALFGQDSEGEQLIFPVI